MPLPPGGAGLSEIAVAGRGFAQDAAGPPGHGGAVRQPSHVTILGAGVIGLCTALYCARRGLGVTVIERKARQRDGCSYGNAGCVRSVYFPQDCHLSPARLMAALDAELARLGVKFLRETEVLGVEAKGRVLREVKTSKGEVTCDEVVLCGGVWSAGLARELAVKIPMQAGKGYSLTLAAPKQLPELCSICTEARLAVTPMDGALRVGGTMEMAGIDESITPRRVRGITRALPEYFPAFTESDFAGVQPWSGLRPVSPDGMPYIGRSQRWKNLTVATGHAMMGLSLAPATGKIVAGLIAGENAPLRLDLMSPDRFA